LQEYDFFILLSEGENFGHAILEGLSAGCPVIISNKTPWQDLEAKNIGWDLSIDNVKNVSKVINEIGEISNEKYMMMSSAAFNYAKDFCEDPGLIEQNKNLFL
jgi:glycosyltransferase involved in cell wall biosynthesis